jgi:tetratricopeptide (TPR) repeat protein
MTALDAAVADSLARFAAKRERAEELITELGEVPFLKLRRLVGRLAAEDPLASTAALLKLAKSGETSPQRATAFARLALFAAQSSPLPGRFKRALCAEAEALMGDGWRRQGKLHDAERAFSRAARHLEEADDPGASANFCRLLADLRHDQRRIEEALALRERAASLFAGVGQTDDQAQALLDKAASEMGRDKVARALSDLRAVIALADQGLRPDATAALAGALLERLSTLQKEEPSAAGLGADESENED